MLKSDSDSSTLTRPTPLKSTLQASSTLEKGATNATSVSFNVAQQVSATPVQSITSTQEEQPSQVGGPIGPPADQIDPNVPPDVDVGVVAVGETGIQAAADMETVPGNIVVDVIPLHPLQPHPKLH